MTSELQYSLDSHPSSLVKDGDCIEESSEESQSLAHENDIKSLLIKEIEQRIRIRWIAFSCAVGAMILIAIFSCVMVYAMPRQHLFYYTPSYLTVAAIVAPIMSISAICITILLGAFRKPAEKEDGNINMTSLAAEALKSSINS